jgi:hypothetical protein
MRAGSAAARSLLLIENRDPLRSHSRTREVHDERRSRKHSWNVTTPEVSFVANHGLQGLDLETSESKFRESFPNEDGEADCSGLCG